MKIKEYIKELLFTNQGVIIPGLGGFVSDYEPAAFDINENKFLPPSKKITFKEEYSYQDSLLLEFISKKEKTDKEQSKNILEDFVKDTKEKLNQGEQIDFPEIGILYQSTKGEILFKQSKKTNLLSDSFGLKSITTKQIPVQQKPSVERPKPTALKKSYKKLVIVSSTVVVFLLLIVAGWYLTNGFDNFNFQSSNTSDKDLRAAENKILEITEKNLDSIAKADSLKALIVNSIDENTDKKDALFYQEPKKEEPKSKYSEFHIIAGSFKKMENAEKFSAELKKKGYNPKIIKSGENLIRIAIFSYTNESDALKQLYKLRETSGIKSVWILKSI